MELNEQILNDTLSKRMKKFDADEFKETHSTLLAACLEAMELFFIEKDSRYQGVYNGLKFKHDILTENFEATEERAERAEILLEACTSANDEFQQKNKSDKERILDLEGFILKVKEITEDILMPTEGQLRELTKEAKELLTH